MQLPSAITKSCTDTFLWAGRDCHQHPVGFRPVVTFAGLGAATNSCWLTGQGIKAICQSRWSEGLRAQDSVFQALGGVGDVRDDQG